MFATRVKTGNKNAALQPVIESPPTLALGYDCIEHAYGPL